MRNFTAQLAIGSMLFCLFVVGCGGDDDGQIDKATFASRADLLCKQISGQMAAEARVVVDREERDPRVGTNFPEAEIALAREVFIPGLEKELRKLRALGIPAETAQEVGAYLRAYEKAIDIAKQKPKEVVAGASPYEPVEFIGTKLGISECPVAPVLSGGN